MKPRFLRSTSIFATLLPLVFCHARAAQTYQDGNALNTWNTSDFNWDAGVQWTDGNDAIFAGTGEAVAVGTVAAHNLTINSANYVLNGGTITLNGTTPTIAGSASATINSILAGTDGLTKSGAGVLTLNGVNTYTGLTKVLGNVGYSGTNSGLTLGSAAKINGNFQLGDGSSPGTVAVLKMGAANQFATTSVLDLQAGTAYTSGAELKLMGFSQTVAGLTSNGRGDNVIQNAENETGSGTTILTIDTAGSNYSFGGTIRNSWNSGAQNGFGTLGITKTGLGTQTLTGATSYTGLTRVSGGTLELGTGTNINRAVTIETNGTLKLTGNINGNGSGALLIDGGTFNVASAGINQTISGFSSITMNNGTLTAGVANTSPWGAFHLYNANQTITATGTNTISGTGVMGFQLNSILTLSPTGVNDVINVTGSIGVAGQASSYTGGIAKSGAGTVTLSGANLYTGGTTVKNGSLVLAGGNDRLLSTRSITLGDVSTSGKLVLGDASAASNQTLTGIATTGLGGSVVGGNATTDSVLTLNIASGTSAFAGTLGGAGSNEDKLALAKSGNGTLTLNGTHTFSGATTVNAGKLDLNGSLINSALSVADGTTVGGEGSSASITLGSSAGADLLATPSTAGALTATGALTVNGLTLVDLAGAISNPSFKVINFGSNANGFTDANFDLANAGIYRPGYAFTVNANDVTLTLGKKSLEWTGNVDDVWDLGSTANFRDTTTLTPETFYSPDEVLFGNLPGADQNLTLVGTLAPKNVTIDSQYNYTLGGAGTISGSCGLLKDGTGTLTLTGANNYSGGTTVSNGALSVSGFGGSTAAHALGGYSVASGAVLNLDYGTQATATFNTFSGNIVVNGTLNLNQSGAVVTADGSVLQGSTSGLGISGAGVINKSDNGKITIATWAPSGNSLSLASFTGTINVNAGTLAMNRQDGVVTGSTSMTLNIASGATFDRAQGAFQTDRLTGLGSITNRDSVAHAFTVGGGNGSSQFDGSITGTNLPLTKAGTGTLTLTGANTYTGSTTINGGTLALSNGSAIANTGAVILADAAGVQLVLNNSETIGSLAGGGATGGNVNLQGNTLTVGNASNTSFAGGVSGTGGLTKVGAGTLTLSGSNSYSGNTTVNAGILSLSSTFLADSSTVTLASGAKLNLNTGAADTVGTLILGGVTMGPGTYNASHPTYGSYFTGTGSLVVGGSAYDSWVASKGLSGANALPSADPDNDGIKNALEFVIGGEPNPANPGSNSSNLLPSVNVSGSNLVFTFRRADAAKDMAGVTIATEYGSNLTSWTTAQNGVNGVTITTSDDFYGTGVDKVAVSVPMALASNSKLFARLKVILP